MRKHYMFVWYDFVFNIIKTFMSCVHERFVEKWINIFSFDIDIPLPQSMYGLFPSARLLRTRIRDKLRKLLGFQSHIYMSARQKLCWFGWGMVFQFQSTRRVIWGKQSEMDNMVNVESKHAASVVQFLMRSRNLKSFLKQQGGNMLAIESVERM